MKASRLPVRSDFPADAQFVIKEFDVPLVHEAGIGWFNWYNGTAQAYDPAWLRADNNWPAESFGEWVALIKVTVR
jgi:hypothetical protein